MSTPMFKFEKRAAPRFTFELEGTAEVVNRRVAGPAGGWPVRTINVGGGGVMITLDGEANVGDLLRIQFRAGFGVEPVTVTAQVVWQRRNAMRLLGLFTAGLAFRPADQDGAVELAARARRTAERAEPAPGGAAVVQGGVP